MSSSAPVPLSFAPLSFSSEEKKIFDFEYTALKLWYTNDMRGYARLFAEEVSFFDPFVEKRLQGKATVTDYIVETFEGKMVSSRFEMANPQVVVDGNLALISYDLRNFVLDKDGKENQQSAWNFTGVYRKIEGQWKVVHCNYSLCRFPPALQLIHVG